MKSPSWWLKRNSTGRTSQQCRSAININKMCTYLHWFLTRRWHAHGALHKKLVKESHIALCCFWSPLNQHKNLLVLALNLSITPKKKTSSCLFPYIWTAQVSPNQEAATCKRALTWASQTILLSMPKHTSVTQRFQPTFTLDHASSHHFH